MASAQLNDLTWDDFFTRTLPGDPSGRPGSRQVMEACYALVSPTPVSAPRLIGWSADAALAIGVVRPQGDSAHEIGPRDAMIAEILGGNRVLPGMKPYAAGYGGHQFGTWAGQLGDGRAITLGDVVNDGGQRWEIQLKGAGPTPYSRRSDGRAVLRSSIREFLCSEAMHHLGVPTTRALSLVSTGDTVVRDMFYDGRARAEPGAIVCRLAPTFVRFGSFELLSWRHDHELLRDLAYLVIKEHFPELGPPSPAVIPGWFSEICRRTAVMIAHWMRVGFVHGVMNTDNMSILGLTIDYGPYGWLDAFDPDFTPNTTDFSTGRYRFGMQPGIAQWNLAHLARALTPLCSHDGERQALAAGLEVYRETFDRTYGEMMLNKLGLAATSDRRDGEDAQLVNDLLPLLSAAETDMTLFFRSLAEVPVRSASELANDELLAPLLPAMYTPPGDDHRAKMSHWLRRYLVRVGQDPAGEPARQQRMAAANPVFVLRNYLVQQVIERAEAGDLSGIAELLRAARSPYREGPEHAGLLGKRPDWARDAPGCGALSCSS